MRVFISYAFNKANKWVEELVIPLVKSFGYEVVTGQRMAGEVLVEGVDERLRGCSGCVAFTTRRAPRGDNTYETHPWVVAELTKARALKHNTIEVREEGVRIGDEAEGYVHLEYRKIERDRMLVALAEKLASWRTHRVRIQLVPPKRTEDDFNRCAVRGLTCTYEIQLAGRKIASGEAKITPVVGGCFIEIEVPTEDVLIQISIKKTPEDGVAWASPYTGVLSIPVQLH